MHIWPKFGNPDFNRCWLIVRTNSQAQYWVNLEFKVQFDLKDQSQSPHKTIGISTFTLLVVFYITAPNLVILAETVAELSRGQARDWRTHELTHRQTDRQTNGHTHTGNDNTRRPKLASGKNQMIRICRPRRPWYQGQFRAMYWIKNNDNNTIRDLKLR